MDFIQQQPESRFKQFLQDYKLYLIIGVAVVILLILVIVISIFISRRLSEERVAEPELPPIPRQEIPAAVPAQPSARQNLTDDERRSFGIAEGVQARWVIYPNGFRVLDISSPEIQSVEPDADFDGLSDAREQELGTDPQNFDSDGDGIDDGTEVNVLKTDPKNPDTDGDGKTDAQEVRAKTNPLKRD